MKLKKGKKHNNKGFTLTEVLVALAVSSVVIRPRAILLTFRMSFRRHLM